MQNETNTLLVPLTLVDEGQRSRKDYGDLSGLKDSLVTLGSIHPIVLSKTTDERYLLVAGGRRFRAVTELGIACLTHGSVLCPGEVGFLFRDEVPEDVVREAELDENLHRLKPKWQEDIVLIDDVHRLKRAKFGTNNWGLRQTAELLGPGYGRTQVNHAIRIAKLIRSGDKDILACSNMSEAISLLIKRKEDDALAELQKRLSAKAGGTLVAGIVLPSATSTSSFLDSFNAPTKTILPVQGVAVGVTSGPAEPSAPVDVPLSRMFFLGDFQDIVSSWPNACLDHIVTDIPYGIDMTNLDASNVADVVAEHDVEDNMKLFEPFLVQAFRLVKSGGFCVFFYDLDWHEYLQATAEMVGWKVQRWPFFACKTSPCKNQAPQYNRTKNVEVAMYLRRDEKTVLRSPCPSSWAAYDFASERRLYNNPFAKPFALWKDIYDSIAFPGQTVGDLFCGEMSACRAAVNCGLSPRGVEKVPQHYNRGLEHMKAVFALVHKSNVNFI